MSDKYGAKIDSRCPLCREFATEGQPHKCSSTGETVIHENPAAPKEEEGK